MSETYKQICAERCGWCAAGVKVDAFLPKYSHVVLDPATRCFDVMPCTAPTPEQFIEEQAAALNNARLLAMRALARRNSPVTGKNREEWQHILRFCADGGCGSSVLRKESH